MIKSFGGILTYLCPVCHGTNIRKTHTHGAKSVLCLSCQAWYPWKWRIKVRDLKAFRARQAEKEVAAERAIEQREAAEKAEVDAEAEAA